MKKKKQIVIEHRPTHLIPTDAEPEYQFKLFCKRCNNMIVASDGEIPTQLKLLLEEIPCRYCVPPKNIHETANTIGVMIHGQ